jgi:hypothetical protein
MRLWTAIGASVAIGFLRISIACSTAQTPAVRPVDETALREYSGAYQWGTNAFPYLRVWNEFTGTHQLVALDESGEGRTLCQMDRDRFFAGPAAAAPTATESRVEVQRDSSGKIASLTWQREGASPRMAPRNEAVRVRLIPERPNIERGEFTQDLNFDFLFQNMTDSRLTLSRIQVSVLDEEGGLVLRKFISASGSLAPGIETLPRRNLEGKGLLCIFNPFHTLDANIPIMALQYDFLFDANGSQKQYGSSVTFRPLLYKPGVNLTLPLKARAVVYDGHDFYSHHRRIDLSNPAAQAMGLTDNPVRYAYDFCVVNEKGELYSDGGEKPEGWLGYGKTVYAPGSGRIVSVRNDVPDNRIDRGRLVYPEGGTSDQKSRQLGNHVIIDHGTGEYSVLAHLKQGSVVVKLNDEIRQGRQVGKIGFSGDTGLHVHLHYHLSNQATPAGSQGLPSYFSNFRRVFGSRAINVKKGRVNTGEIVEGAKSGAKIR